MGARGEHIPSPVPWDDLPTAAAWLLGYVHTSVPGYRSFDVSGVTYTVTSAEYRFDALLEQMNTQLLAAIGETVTDWSATGRGQYDAGGASENMDGTLDRLGWIIGAGNEAGFVSGINPRYIPPAGVPLIGYTWDRCEKDADRNTVRDLYRRHQGYTWGGADIFRCRLHMHRWSLDAFLNGWCTRGKVTLGGAAKLDDPWSLADPKGAITGYVLGTSQPRWTDSIQSRAIVEMAIAVAP